MNRFKIHSSLTIFSFLIYQPLFPTSPDEGDYKKAISLYQSLIKEETEEKKELLTLKLAVAYLKDQDQETAFKTFLELLEKMKKETPPTMNQEEERLYQEALHIYLDHKGGTPQQISKKIINEYAPFIEDHPHAYQLAYIVAAAYANLNQYEKFFGLFYNTYRFYPDHFLAYKTKGVLHIKLFERSRSSSEKEFHRNALLSFFSQALERQPSDDSLYKFLIVFSSPQEKSNMLQTCLNKIVDNNIIISRSEIPFYVEKAVEANDLPLAQRFIEKAREWYQPSRIVDAAQQYLDKQMNK